MSQGPGVVMQKLQLIFQKHPGEMFTTSELCRSVYGVRSVQKKHRVSVLRALKKMGSTSMPTLWRWVLSYEKSDDVWFEHRAHQAKPRGCAPASSRRPPGK